MDDVIVERRFDREGDLSICVAIGKPKLRGTEEWSCDIYIVGPQMTVKHTAFGADSLQALLIGIEFLKTDVAELKEKYGAGITFLGQGDLWLMGE